MEMEMDMENDKLSREDGAESSERIAGPAITPVAAFALTAGGVGAAQLQGLGLDPVPPIVKMQRAEDRTNVR